MKTITAFLLAAGASLVHAQDDTSAATKYGWGTPVQEDDFNGSTLSSDWGVYDGPGQDGNGIRSPSAFSLSDSILTVTGTPNGTTGGMAWSGGQMYGRWETRAKYTAGTSAYHCVLLLWPDAENWPEGGEIDYSEVGDGTRQTLDFFLHYGSDNSQLNGETTIDMTQWRNYAIEWTSDHIIGYVDAVPFFQTTQQSALPPASMHATIQLDWFPEDGEEGPGEMQVDWIRQYIV